MWDHLCIACMGLICLVWGLFLVWRHAASFLSVCWPLSPWEGVWLVLWWPELALDIEWGLLFALWLSLPCEGQSLLPSCWDGSPQMHFWAEVWGRCDWNSPTERGASEYSSARAVHQQVSSLVSPFTCCFWPCPQPHLNYGNARSALGSLRCCFHKTTSTDPLKSGPKTTAFM